MDREVKIQVSMKTKNMYEFLMRHFYKSASGVIGVILSISAFIYLIFNYQGLSSGKVILLIFGSLLFTVLNPISLYFRAAQQVKLVPMFREDLQYILREDEIIVRQHEDELSVLWSDVKKVVETKNNIIIYVSKVRAFILPKESFVSNEEMIKQMIHEKVKNNKTVNV